MVTWVDGEVLRRDALTPAIAASLGRGLATLGQAFRDFDHCGQARELDWDLQRALCLRERTPFIGDAPVRAEVEGVLEEFERDGLPLFSRLRRQFIHNDANPDNVLSNRRDRAVTGFIDFGDVVEAPLVADVAIAGSYLRDVRDPLRLLAPFVSAYHEVTPLTAEELPEGVAEIAVTIQRYAYGNRPATIRAMFEAVRKDEQGKDQPGGRITDL